MDTGAGGGGAAGPNGVGNVGGGGNEGGGGTAGGSGDAGLGGAGGSCASPGQGGVAGANGTEWDSSHGSGGGGCGPATAGGLSGLSGGAGGNYGGGGGSGNSTGSSGGAGKQGIIVITYTPTCNRTCITESSSFAQNLIVDGTVSKGSGSFVIDHPLDPKNKLLYHSFVESPDVKNIYDGIATLDKNGEATIELPVYFLALNKDFRYLGTPIGQPMPNLFVKQEVRKRFFGLFGRPVFKISGGAPNGRVSWQVTGIRQDPLITLRPIRVEVEKGPDQLVGKGEYLHPDVYESE